MGVGKNEKEKDGNLKKRIPPRRRHDGLSEAGEVKCKTQGQRDRHQQVRNASSVKTSRIFNFKEPE